MARIELQALAHTYAEPTAAAGAWALNPLSMSLNDGGAYALLGPSGCGKTTLLNLISGLLKPTQGRILFDGHDVTALPPQHRNVAQVFQFPVVYETMTVFDNLAFPLRNRNWTTAAIRKRVEEIAEILELEMHLRHRAQELGADLRQKISLGRGLVRTDVAAVLFDEPLTVIDPHLKWLLRRKLKQIHRQLSLSLIYVTHDQTEALTFADHVIVMMQGEVVQSGTPQQLFEAPRHRFVGDFIGSPGMNFMPCTWRDGRAYLGSHALLTASRTTPQAGASLALGIRPEFATLHGTAGDNCVPARITGVQDLGVARIVSVDIAGHAMRLKTSAHDRPPGGDTVFVHFSREHCALYANDTRVA